MFPCFDPECNDVFLSGDRFVCHVRLFHSNVTSFKCTHPNCLRVFDRMRCFSRHVNSHKPEIISAKKPRIDVGAVESKSPAECVTVDSNLEHGDDQSISFENTKPAAATAAIDFERAVTNSALAFVTKLYSIDTICRSHIQLIIDSIREQLSTGYLDILEEAVMNALAENSDPSVTINLKQMFKSFRGMYDGLESETKRLNVFKKSGAYIPPEPYVIGHTLDERHSHGHVSVTPSNLTGQFMPMRSVLKAFLELPGVLPTILNYMDELERSDRGVIENFIQGKLWREKIKPRFDDKLVLPINGYFDEFDPCDPLSSHSSVYKIGGVYYNIPCIPPKYRSTLDNIFTAILFHANDRCFGNDQAFRPFLRELKFLEEEGITVVTDDKETQVYFAFSLFLGDNLAVHGVIGFAESFVARFWCRTCKVDRETASTQIQVDPLLLRNKLNYEYDLGLDDVSRTGIKERCMWNELKSFHCMENISYDLMHDLDEGAWDYDLCSILDDLIYKKKRFSLEDLNDRIQGFQYGFCESGNAPPLISGAHIKRRKLHFTAAERQCFVRYLGLMIGDLIFVEGEDHDLWIFYGIIHEILEIHSAPAVSETDVAFLRNRVREHHRLFLKLFPNEHLKPKHHQMLHHADALMQIGPLKNVSCWSFESKHKPSKQYANVTYNYKNLPFSLAVKNQLKLCSRLLSRRGFDVKIDVPDVETVSVTDVEDHDYFSHLLSPDTGMLHTLKWVKNFGTDYVLGMLLVVKVTSEFPVFGEIRLIVFSKSDEVSFVLRAFHTKNYSTRYQAFEVTDSDEWFYIEHRSLVSFLPTDVRTGPDGKKYVTYRYRL